MTQLATFAGGCFWCLTRPFAALAGAISVVTGYCGCQAADPTYESVSRGNTGCLEAVQVRFDETAASYQSLCDLLFRLIDPCDDGGQFCDRGPQYRTAIFYHSEEQRSMAELARLRAAGSGRFDKPIVTAVRPFRSFTPAEEYHQDYPGRCPLNYRVYHDASGRPAFLHKTWTFNPGYPPAPIEAPEEELREKLSREAYRVAVLGGTEHPAPGSGAVPKTPGIYVDVLSGAPLFRTQEQVNAAGGWPSFTAPVEPGCVSVRQDNRRSAGRAAVVGAASGAHLGHLVREGASCAAGRYCINAAALRFIPEASLAAHGYT